MTPHGDAPTTPPDEEAREAIRARLGDTLFVEAGAGSGKTKSLVDRVVALVESGRKIGSVAAITFTEKAAGELRDRVRGELERRARGAGSAPDETRRKLLHDALADLDSAAISTLHSFARRLLAECPIEAGLPPGVQVHDEISSEVAFDDRWTGFVDRLLDDETLGRSLLLLATAGVSLDRLRQLAVAAGDNWDLVDERGMASPVPDPPPLDATRLLDGLDEVCAELAHAPESDTMTAVLDELAVYARRLHAARGDEFETLRLLCEAKPSFKSGGKGRQANWPGRDLRDLQARIAALGEERDRLRNATTEAALRRVAGAIGAFTLEAAEQRRQDGILEFHDLLVLARRMLRDPVHGPTARDRLRGRYERLLLDEFQDTDPIQIELAVLLASFDEDAPSKEWAAFGVDPGRLFVVGDPKQSIYRFRRADIGTFLRARDRLGAGDALLELTCNFRTVPAIIAWVNHTFARLIRHEADSQPEYRDLAAARNDGPVNGGPTVLLMGTAAHADQPDAGALREREAADVVTAIRSAVGDGWQVGERGADGRDTWRAARLGDICVLLPARTSLPQLEDALDEAGIPYRAETSSLVYNTREIRDLLMVLRAIDDPTDELALVSALRTPVFACGDDDLFDFRVNKRGRWNHQAPLPDGLPPDHPVGQAILYLCALHRDRHWLAPSELLDRIVRERRVLEAAFASGRPRDVWRRVRYVIDQARAFTESSGGSLRAFLHWAELQTSEGARVAETILPETDDDAVRILTIHGAKGLEFPIVVVSGTTSAVKGNQNGARLSFPRAGGWEVKLGAAAATAGYDAYQPLDEQMGLHEKLRLLYVATTRARDHLVVSVHRKNDGEPPNPTRATLAELLSVAASEAPHAVDLADLPQPATALPATTAGARPALPAFDEWNAEIERVLEKARAPQVLSATAIARAARGAPPTRVDEAPGEIIEDVPATGETGRDGEAEVAAGAEATPGDDPGLAKEPRDLELPPWLKGRYGTAIGRAVHAVLQTVDLVSGSDVDAVAGAQAEAEAVRGYERRVAALVRSALASRPVREVVEHDYPFWRETYVATPVGDRLLEGYVDLIFRRPDGLVVVDYKTDAVAGDADLETKLDLYRLQGAAYALAAQRATGEPVASCVFLFLGEDGARECEVPDLAAAMAEVERRVTEF